MQTDFTRFRAVMNEDAAIQARLRKGENPVTVAQELGYDVAPEDFETAVKDEAAELTEFELELVSGGVVASSWGKTTQTSPMDPLINTINQKSTPSI
jgi:hypothetical protein